MFDIFVPGVLGYEIGSVNQRILVESYQCSDVVMDQVPKYLLFVKRGAMNAGVMCVADFDDKLLLWVCDRNLDRLLVVRIGVLLVREQRWVRWDSIALVYFG